MKRSIMLAIVLTIIQLAHAQGISINENGIPPEATAMLDVSSHTKGMLVPRLRTDERNAIQNPADGLLAYDIDTHSFWFVKTGVWKEILNQGSPLPPSGAASGDLTGSYPSPTVAKIQNLDIASGVPFDKQVLKWDALANNWKGRNDSLFLPYNVAYGSATKLFGIQNNNTTNGSSAVYGRSGSTGSGITPGNTMGVWGDNSTGLGVVGTSSQGVGTYGFSSGNHGVYGYSTLAGFAGVVGSHANAGGIGVMGDISNSGMAVYGKSNGITGKAGLFVTTNTSNTDTTLVVKSSGFGSAGSFTNSNPGNGNPILQVNSNASGDGIYSDLTNTGNFPHANFRAYNHSLGGYAFYGQSDLGTSGYFFNTDVTNNNFVIDAKTAGLSSVGNFTIANTSNNSYILKGTTNGLGGAINMSLTNTSSTATGINLTQSGYGIGINISTAKGKAGVFAVTDATSFNETLNVSTSGDAKNAILKSNNTNSFETDLYVEQNGNGKGIDVNLTKASNTFAGIAVTTAGNKGIEVVSAGIFGVTASATANNSIAINGNTGQTANNAIAVRGLTGANTSDCIGVFGQTGVNDDTGIGVKGISNSTGTDRGAVTGINNSTGVGVYGEALSWDGVGIYGLAGSNTANSHAAVFKNINSTNARTVVEVSGNGTGTNLFVNNTNGGNSNALARLRNSGTGLFLNLEDGGASTITSIAKNGNIITDGTMVVKGDKGIVRNSSGTQLRTEILSAALSLPGGGATVASMSSNTVHVNFGSAFASAPIVSVGNIVSDGDNASFFITCIKNVTTTGCDLIIRNISGQSIYLSNSTWKVIAIGAE